MAGRWRAIGATVRGAAHERRGAPNQDALRWWPRQGIGAPLVLAVADGHGGADYGRSHIGAQLAVRTAVQVLARDLLQVHGGEAGAPDLARCKRTCTEWLPKVLVRTWQERVRRHARRYPLAGGESGNEATPTPERHTRPDPTLQAYGSTLLAVLLTRHFHLYLQLGDGDILTVAPDGLVARPPLPGDSRLLGNDTTSLCLPEAWRHVRVYFQPQVARPPALILLATDGYVNSFVDSSAFARVGSDLLAAVRSEGVAAVAEHLPGWLAETSAAGSGDDITVALGVQFTSGVVE